MNVLDSVIAAVNRTVTDRNLPPLHDFEEKELRRLVQPELEFLAEVEEGELDNAVNVAADIVLARAALSAVRAADGMDSQLRGLFQGALALAAVAMKAGAPI